MLRIVSENYSSSSFLTEEYYSLASSFICEASAFIFYIFLSSFFSNLLFCYLRQGGSTCWSWGDLNEVLMAVSRLFCWECGVSYPIIICLENYQDSINFQEMNSEKAPISFWVFWTWGALISIALCVNVQLVLVFPSLAFPIL